MSRIAIIGDNSVEYINILLNIWNDGDSAVLLDRGIPLSTACSMMEDAGVIKCYIENKFLKSGNFLHDFSIEFIIFETSGISVELLPESIYKKFNDNYSNDEAVVIYSSGTTGTFKGVILSHYAINNNADAIIAYMNLTLNDCIYIVKPFSHSSTLTGELLVALKSKTKLIISLTMVTPSFILKNISKFDATILCLNPFLIQLLAEEYQRHPKNISSLKTIYVSGSIFNEKIYRFSHEVFNNVNIYNVYGLSEAGPRVTAQCEKSCLSNSVGNTIKNVEISLFDDYGNNVDMGDYGIIYVKTPSLFKGYVISKDNTTLSSNGWFCTKDIGYIDINGELHIVGRLDDVIIINSHKIYPDDIEKQIMKNKNINECSVVKICMNENEFIGCLYSSPYNEEDAIIRYLNSTLIKYEIPKYFVRCDKIPRNINGKVSKKLVEYLILEDIKKQNL